jgi:hypothetical protein
MGTRKGTLYNFGLSLFSHLTGFYPEIFRRQFAGEITGVLVQKLEDAAGTSEAAIISCVLRESTALTASIIREHWHERWGRKTVSVAGDEMLYRRVGRIFLMRRLKSAAKVILPLAGFVVLLNACAFAYAGIQIAQAKQRGAFPTVEDAVYGLSSGEYRSASVMRVDINHIEPCYSDGSFPYVMCVDSTVWYDQIPAGFHHSKLWGKSAYFHLKEGWVQISLETLPRHIFSVVELFGMQSTGH